MILKEVLESYFCSRFIKDSIKGTTKNDKMSNKSSQKLLKIPNPLEMRKQVNAI
jgi:hypothetical protein